MYSFPFSKLEVGYSEVNANETVIKWGTWPHGHHKVWSGYFTPWGIYYIGSLWIDWCARLFKFFEGRERHAARCKIELEMEIVRDLSTVRTDLGASWIPVNCVWSGILPERIWLLPDKLSQKVFCVSPPPPYCFIFYSAVENAWGNF